MRHFQNNDPKTIFAILLTIAVVCGIRLIPLYLNTDLTI